MTTFVIRKSSRGFGVDPYTGPASTMIKGYTGTYDNLHKATEIAAMLGMINPVGFEVYDLETKERVWSPFNR